MERLVPIARFYPNVLPSSAGLSFATAHTLNNLPLLVQQAQLSEIRRALLALDIFPSPKELQRVSERFDPVHGALSFLLDQKTFLFSFDVKVRDVAVDQFLVPMYPPGCLLGLCTTFRWVFIVGFVAGLVSTNFCPLCIYLPGWHDAGSLHSCDNYLA